MIPRLRFFPLARRLRLPLTFLIVLLQRMPAIRLLAVAEDWAASSPLSAVLRSVGLAAAGLGALDTLAGATSVATVSLVIISGPSSPMSAKTGTAITPVAFGVTGAGANTPNSWTLVSGLPPGLSFGGVTTPRQINVSFPTLTGTPTTVGNYSMVFYATYSGVSTNEYAYQINVAAAGPSFTTQPTSRSVSAGQTATFSVTATGATSYQWLFNGTPIPGATSSSLVLPDVQFSSAGSYQVSATNSSGTILSNAATLTVVASVPSFTVEPQSVTVASGSTAVMQVQTTSSPAPTFQWWSSTGPIAGATSSRLVFTGATAANAGFYYCSASNAGGTTSSTAATLTVTTTTNPGRIGNLSVLSNFTAGQLLTIGFVSGGTGTTGPQSLLIRTTGPSLAAIAGLSGTMADPQFQAQPLGQSTIVAANDNWGTPVANQTQVLAADAATGAFALLAGSTDAATVAQLPSGSYTIQVTGTGPGIALTEMFDMTPAATYTAASQRLVNISCNNQIAVGGSLTAGFTVGGMTAKTILIRAMGPTLSSSYGVPGTMADPQVTVYDANNTILASNAGWGGDGQLATAASSVSAFAFANANSLDSAVLITLPPGSYTAVVSSASGGGGTALVEAYEIP